MSARTLEINQAVQDLQDITGILEEDGGPFKAPLPADASPSSPSQS